MFFRVGLRKIRLLQFSHPTLLAAAISISPSLFVRIDAAARGCQLSDEVGRLARSPEHDEAPIAASTHRGYGTGGNASSVLGKSLTPRITVEVTREKVNGIGGCAVVRVR